MSFLDLYEELTESTATAAETIAIAPNGMKGLLRQLYGTSPR